MPDDAKLGLLAGVAAVILGAVVYLPKPESPPASPPVPTASVPVALGPPIVPEAARGAMTTSLARGR